MFRSRSNVPKTHSDKGFHDSLAMLREEAAFAKAAPFGGPFAKCVADLRHYLRTGYIPGEPGSDGWAQGLMDRARGNGTRSSRTFAKALVDLDAMTKAAPSRKPARVVSVEVHDPAAEPAAIVRKSFAALQSDPHLTPEQRGQLMLGLSSLADKTFKSQDAARIAKVEAALAMIDRARAAKLSDDADPLIEKIREACRRGETEPGDLLALESRLHEIRRKLEDRHEKE
jgi:hypothetical protein